MEKGYTPRKIRPLDYQCRTADPQSIRFAITHMRWASCPYWIGHAQYKNRLLGDLLFDKWNQRPNSAYKLYWRLHPDEYLGAQQVYKNRKKK